MKNRDKIIALLSFAMYFVTGAACMIVGSGLTHLVKMYGLKLDVVVLLGSAFAIGRVSTVYLTGYMVDKSGPLKVLAMGSVLLGLYLLGIPTIKNFYFGLAFAFLGGAGMGAQDTACPVLLSSVYKNNYAGSLSAGQALFGLGSFATPFLVGIFLMFDMPFYYAYYALLAVPVFMLICIPFAKENIPRSETRDVELKEEESNVKPLYTTNRIMAYACILIVAAAYSAIVNTIGLYTSSIGENLGMKASNAAFLLTVYNIGCMVGSLVFVIILKKVKEQTVLIANSALAFVSILIGVIVNSPVAYFPILFIAGFFLGVLFSVIVAIGTRIGYKNIGRAGSMVAAASGASDILTPIVTGFLIGRFGIAFSFRYAMLMIVLCIVFTFMLSAFTKNENN